MKTLPAHQLRERMGCPKKVRGFRDALAVFGLLGLAALLAACANQPAAKPGTTADETPAVEPRAEYEPLSKKGNRSPYRVAGRSYFVLPRSKGYAATGLASWYGKEFHGKLTSNEEVFDMHALTAAHRTLPLPSYVRVTNLENGREVTVRVNDRGPFKDDRLIDLSHAAAQRLGIIDTGTAMVEVRTLTPAGVEQRPDVRHADNVYLQIGAFAERDNALVLLRRLRADKIDAGFVHTGEDAAGRTIHRVRIGPLEDAAAAEAMAERVARLGLERSTVVFE